MYSRFFIERVLRQTGCWPLNQQPWAKTSDPMKGAVGERELGGAAVTYVHECIHVQIALQSGC